MSKVATIVMPLTSALREKITRQIFCRKLLNTLYDKITEYNKKISISMEPDNAAIHMVDCFTLGECVKNSLDSKSTELTVSIHVGFENDIQTVNITLSDNGTGTENTMQPYQREKAFLFISEKQIARNKGLTGNTSLGGLGKGLAMSSQFIALFHEGSLSTGKSTCYPQGFEVSITAPNKMAVIRWENYFAEFERGFENKIKHMRGDRSFSPTRPHDDSPTPPKSPQSTIKKIEEKFKRKVERGQNESPLASPLASPLGPPLVSFSPTSPLRLFQIAIPFEGSTSDCSGKVEMSLSGNKTPR